MQSKGTEHHNTCNGQKSSLGQSSHPTIHLLDQPPIPAPAQGRASIPPQPLSQERPRPVATMCRNAGGRGPGLGGHGEVLTPRQCGRTLPQALEA